MTCFPWSFHYTDEVFKFSVGSVDHSAAGIASKQRKFPVSVNADKASNPFMNKDPGLEAQLWQRD